MLYTLWLQKSLTQLNDQKSIENASEYNIS